MPIDKLLTAIEARVLGSLIEKELTTPEYYPLSLNGLQLACNQKSNREPMMSLSEHEVLIAVDSLRGKQLAWQRSVVGARVMKYEHNLTGKWQFGADEVAVLCVLLLRGPQTVGEIRGRSDRLHAFNSLPEVEATLQKLANRAEGPFVYKLPRIPGHKENRYDHLFCGEREIEQEEPSITEIAAPVNSLPPKDRLSTLESEVQSLRQEIEYLKAQFQDFKKQFE